MTQYILIDDDPLIHKIWKYSAKKNGVDLKNFIDPNEFFLHLHSIPKEAILCFDFNFNMKNNGHEFAILAKQQGFKNIFLITGYKLKQLEHINLIIAIADKRPLWEQLKPIHFLAREEEKHLSEVRRALDPDQKAL